jgi:hypothetical protein
MPHKQRRWWRRRRRMRRRESRRRRKEEALRSTFYGIMKDNMLRGKPSY